MVAAPDAPAGAGPDPGALPLAVDRVTPSRLLQYLPAIYSGDEFIGRFLRIFEDVHTPVRRMAGGLPSYFDPAVAPEALQEALGEWVGAGIEGPLRRLPPEIRGRLVRESVELHRWRGTRRGLRRALEIATGRTPWITDAGNGLVLGDDASLGANTSLEGAAPFEVTVTFDCEEDEIDAPVVDAIIRGHRPAHVSHTVVFAPHREG